jgi:hypothetical protein
MFTALGIKQPLIIDNNSWQHSLTQSENGSNNHLHRFLDIGPRSIIIDRIVEYNDFSLSYLIRPNKSRQWLLNYTPIEQKLSRSLPH